MRTKKTIVILISGKAGSGKSLTATLLQQELDKLVGITNYKYSFAKPIKFMARKFIGWDEEKDDKGRKLLQEIGRIGREYNINVWVDHLLKKLDELPGLLPVNFVIVDDWRFENEYKYLAENPLFEVVAMRMIGRGGLSGDVAKDVSENSLSEDRVYDCALYNSPENDIKGLEATVSAVVSDLKEKFILE